MNYRHIYHAGNFADVFKHAVLLAVLDYLHVKDKPFFALDTHAGTGLYRLDASEALKTRESAGGVEKVLSDQGRSEILRAYQDHVRSVPGNEESLQLYPGSPWLIRAMLRANDHAVFNERHPEDVQTLRTHLGQDRRVRIESRDGYECVRALLPPSSRRGLVLIDPPFEVTDEFEQMARALRDGIRRFASGIYMLWYPIKDLEAVENFLSVLRGLSLPETLSVQFFLSPPTQDRKFSGTGLLIVNPPWTLADSLKNFLPELVERLAPESGRWSVTPL